MPWTVDDVEKHNKGLSDAQKKTWVRVANTALARCNQAKGKNCDASAIKQANAVVSKKEASFRMLKSIKEKQIVYGIIFEPDFVDAHDEFVSKEDIEDAAYGYMIKLQQGIGSRLKVSHQVEADNVMAVVASFLAPVDFQMGDQLVKKDSWVMGIKIFDKNLWDATNDEITGFSPGGYATDV
jgi:hypothetical protein